MFAPRRGMRRRGVLEDEAAADAWLARFPGGTSALYPQFFLVKPRRGKVVTPTRYLDRTESLSTALHAKFRSLISPCTILKL
jgi:hypothetical protein